MQPGDLLVASNRLYGGSITQLGKTIKKFDWSTEFVDVDNLDAVLFSKVLSLSLYIYRDFISFSKVFSLYIVTFFIW